MLNKKSKYGLKALLFLSGLPLGQSATVAKVAKSQNISTIFLFSILSELQNAGLVVSKKGRDGGYSLARKPNEITANEVIRILNGPLFLLPCELNARNHLCDDCIDKTNCRLRLSLLEAQRTIFEILDKLTLEEMRARADLGEKMN